MPSGKRGRADDGEFFDLVADATFARPFGEERVEIDRKIFGRNASDWLERGQPLHRVVCDRIVVLDKCDSEGPRNHSREEYEVVRVVFFFAD